jgi:hypothetical protein
MDGCTFRHAPGGCDRLDRTAGVFGTERRQRTVACPGGELARYRELRSKPVLTAVGSVQVSRPYYLCPEPSDRPISCRCRTGH